MARQLSVLKVDGSLGELSFYQSVHGLIVRRKGGPSAKQIKTSPKMVRVREHNAEFGHCAEAGKSLRLSLHPLLKVVKDHQLVWRVTQLMYGLKKQDTKNVRGERDVPTGAKSPEGKALFCGFDFNSAAGLKQVFRCKWNFDEAAGELSIAPFVPGLDLKAPKGATHALFTLAWLSPDWKNMVPLHSSEELRIRLTRRAVNLHLQLPELKARKGFVLSVLQIRFVQEINGKDHALLNETGNLVSVVGAGEV